ncbi:hypothetical protein [Paenibacillus sp. N3/727]|nr:hypothetical protein [Paenibacillus sp. N3/727]
MTHEPSDTVTVKEEGFIFRKQDEKETVIRYFDEDDIINMK